MAELARIETVVVLQTVELLSSCSAEQILGISAITHQSLFPAGEVIYREGDPADALYFVVRGSVRVKPSNDEERLLGPGETFGATEILSGRLRSGSATVEKETLVLAIEAEDFFDLLANNIEIVKALFRQLLERNLQGEGGLA
ncbi:MAG: cyclic nucleotide-binding domain-containing protein [Acidobacteria bacterium]|nr:cyclic nucleotide-binding domain-containing protein [Acidobacteriota bacterium]MCZ6727850.1 cyclic nucleotide-binding domain-containing protein [Acidobacteriota bacterium]